MIVNNETFIEIFKAGTYPTWNPETKKFEEIVFSNDTLIEIANSYDPSFHKAPWFIGHPTGDAPALAWVGTLKAQGDTLYQNFSFMSDKFIELIKNKEYANRSVELYKWKVNGKDCWYLGAIGLTNMPLVKGMKQLEFNNYPVHNNSEDLMRAFSLQPLKFSDEQLKSFFLPNNFKSQPNNFKSQNMNEHLLRLAASLGVTIPAGTSEVDIVNILSTKFSQITTENNVIKSELEKIKAERIETLLASAVTDGKIKPAQKEEYFKLAQANFDSTKNILASMASGQHLEQNKVVNVDPSKNLNAGYTPPEDHSGWDFSEWTKNDPAGLQKLKASDPDAYKKLEDEFLSSAKNNPVFQNNFKEGGR